ncbi:translocation/assembly module TamB domain-containing protein [Hahella aquimaris]|uniref:translocation/assembly module TamB domain-containing protein n=1 Tax=Hahella sp. HNIBRBA332 TaxID=3015983 RepID=UPI00273B3A73|nr:translocation/assembly module TamB domain-containing protein [Hahella sp. HNIBRBA332]WLQ11234.1 translocation/assembly module TamB domain-containing protein [Hahella sp. HNIBRBA332]
MLRKWWVRWPAHFFSLIMSLIVFILLLAVTFVGSESGRVWLLDKGLPLALKGSPIRIEVEDVVSPDLGHWSFGLLEVYLNEKQLVRARALDLQVDINSLFAQRVHVDNLSADDLYINLVDTLPESSKEEEETPESGTTAMWPVALDELSLLRLKVKAPGMEDIPAAKIHGSATLYWTDVPLTLELNAGTLTEKPAQVAISTQWDDQKRLTLTATLNEPAGGWLGGLAKMPAWQALDVELKAVAAQSAPSDQAVDSAQAGPTYSIDLQRLKAPLFGHHLHASGKVDVNLDAFLVQTEGLDIYVDQRLQKVRGRVTDEELDAQVDIDRFPLDVLAPWTKDFSTGNASASIRATGSLNDPQASGSASVRTNFSGKPLIASVRGSGGKEKIVVDSLTASLDQLQAQASGTVDLAGESLNIRVTRAQTPLSYLSLLDIAPPEGLELFAEASDVTVTGPYVSPNYEGWVSARGSYLDLPFTVEGGVKGGIDSVTLRDARVNTGEAWVTASGKIDWSKSLLDLSAKGGKIPLDLLSKLEVELPPELGPTLVGLDAKVKGKFTKPEFSGSAQAAGSFKSQAFAVSANLSGSPDVLNFRSFRAELPRALTSEGDSANQAELATLEGSGRVSITKSTLNLNVMAHKLPYSLAALTDVALPPDLSGNVDADLHVEGAFTDPKVSGRLHTAGRYSTLPFVVSGEGSGGTQGVDISSLSANLGDAGRIDLSGWWRPTGFDVSLNGSGVNTQSLQALGWQMQHGVLNTDLRLQGSLQQPRVDGYVAYATDIEGQDDKGRKQKYPLQLHTDIATQEDETLSLVTVIKKDDMQTGRVKLDINARTYLDFLNQLQGELDVRKIPLDVAVAGNLETRWLNFLLDPDIHRFSGDLNLNLTAKGVLGDPLLNGDLKLQDGFYENRITSTLFKDAQANLAFAGRKMTMSDSSASDGGSGKLELLGHVDWNELKGGEESDDKPIELQLIATNASILRRSDMEGAVSGKLTLEGDFKNLLLSGKVEVLPFAMMLDAALGRDIPEIEVREVAKEVLEDESILPLPKVALDIRLIVNQQAFLRGRGLEAELKGRVFAKGPLESASYRGNFETLRGTFEVFGKKFDLQEGEVLFENDSFTMFIVGVYTSKDTEYRAELSGSLASLKVNLSSNPPLPEDEILSQLMFGKSVRNITPIQAYRLAAAVQTLRGEGGSFFDPIATTRDLLGVDTLSVDTQETDNGSGVSVGVGKYLTERVYLELERTPDPAQPWKGSVEVELNPNLNLETTTGGQSGFGGVELQWKQDY